MSIPGTIIAALLTPLSEDGSVSPERLGPLVDFVLSRGVDGIYAGGSTGECMLLGREERASLLRGVASVTRSRCALIAHVGSAATDDAVALAGVARAEGYDAVAAVPPFYYKYSFEEIADYYRAIADAAGMPLMIYSIPSLTGVDLGTESLLTLLEDPRVGGLKYTDSDVYQFTRMRNAAPDKRFYFGSDEMFICAAAAGTDGGIGSTYNLIGDVYAGIRDAVDQGNIQAARALQDKANGLIDILFQTGVVPGLKHAMTRIGIPVGPCRRPFRPAPAAALAMLDRWLDLNMPQTGRHQAVGL